MRMRDQRRRCLATGGRIIVGVCAYTIGNTVGGLWVPSIVAILKLRPLPPTTKEIIICIIIRTVTVHIAVFWFFDLVRTLQRGSGRRRWLLCCIARQNVSVTCARTTVAAVVTSFCHAVRMRLDTTTLVIVLMIRDRAAACIVRMRRCGAHQAGGIVRVDRRLTNVIVAAFRLTMRVSRGDFTRVRRVLKRDGIEY